MAVHKSINIIEIGYDKLHDPILELENKRNELELDIKSINRQIEIIRSNCKHEFYFSSFGIFDDIFICNKCGKRVEL